MNRPDKAGEPSMEEILASIRQIIAEEPSTDTPEPIEANPLVPSHAPKPSEPRVPLADRLSGVLKNGALPPTDPLGSKRPLSFDQDLADMFDDEPPANGSSVAAPKPDIRVPAALSHPMSVKPFVPAPVEPQEQDQDLAIPAKEERAKSDAPMIAEGSARGPTGSSELSEFVPPPPFGSRAETPAAAAAPSPTFGFPPLRKASFYPPQPKVPDAPKPSPFDAIAQPATPEPASVEPAASSGPAAGAPQDGLKGFAGFGSSPLDTSSGHASGPITADPPQPTRPFQAAQPGGAEDARMRAPEPPLSPFAGPDPAPAPFAPEPHVFGKADRASGEARFAAAPTSQADVRPVERSRSYSDPFAQAVPPSAAYVPEPRFEPSPRMSSDAAHQALDALAQGLAASAAATSVSPEPPSPAIPLTPVFEESAPDLRSQQAAGPTLLPMAVSSPGSMPVSRTLEDAVADMLRPMLQQWVAENMPRIIERALRTEVAQTVKPGNKPPGT